MTHKQIITALDVLTPNAEWVLIGDTLDGLEWRDTNQTRPTNEAITTFINGL